LKSPAAALEGTVASAAIRSDRWTALAAVAACAGLFALALWIHPIEAIGAEMDTYSDKAQVLLEGQVPVDVHRPLLYVALTALTALPLGGDVFAAGRLVSAAAGALAAFATWLLGRDLAGRRVGWFAAGLLVVNGEFVIASVQVTTDVLFTAFVVLSLWAALRAARRPGAAPAARLGLCLGLAWFTRYTAVLLLPAALAALLLGERGARAFARRVAIAGAVAFAVVLPQGVLSWISMDSPFHNECWRSVAFRHFGQGDWSFLDDNPFDGLVSVLGHDPGTIARNAGATVSSMLHASLPRILLGGPGPTGGAWILALPALGLIVLLRREVRAAVVLALALVGLLGTLPVLFFDWPRMLLPALPVLYVLSAAALFAALDALPARMDVAPRIAAAAALLCVTAVALRLGPQVQAFEALHPHEEVALARELAARHGGELVLLSDHPDLDLAVDCRSERLRLPSDEGALRAELKRRVWQSPGDYLLLCRLHLGDAAFAALEHAALLDFLALERASPDVRCYRIERGDLALLTRCAPSVTAQGDAWRIAVELDEEVAEGTSVVAVLTGPQGRVMRAILEPAGGLARAVLVSPTWFPAGRWRGRLTALDAAGRLYAGPELELLIAGR
jgi:4-amino-4-deoxy-L-arabinose transferase-like glycosyltransferase